MKTLFVAANVFLRFFTTDDAAQNKKAAAVFRLAQEGKIALLCGPPVLFEVAWTLRAAYRLPNEKILDALSAIAGLSGLRLLDAALVEEAIALARQSGQEFADAYIAASARQCGAEAIATFNRRHFEKMDAPIHPLS